MATLPDMTYPGPRKPADYSAKTAVKTVSIMTGVGLLLLCGIIGVVSLADGPDDATPDVGVTVTAEPAGVDQFVPAPTPTTSAAATSAPPKPPPPPPVKKTAPAPPKTTAPKPPPPPEEEPDDAYYANCAEARADGAAPLYRGDPGYRSGLDRDGDGVACES